MNAVSGRESLIVQGIVLGIAVVSLLISWWANRSASPIIAIFNRWIRWTFISVFFGGFIYLMQWTGYGIFALISVCCLAWFLMETGYNWLAISALSRSDLPLFPHFEENSRGDDWPSLPAFIRLKDWIRVAGFQKKQSLVSNLADQAIMRVSVYDNEDQTIRLQVMFLPNARGHTSVSFVCLSTSSSGDILMTDNIFLPFGGFYPENWSVERSPWTRSLEKLVQRHTERMDAKAEPMIPFVIAPLDQINEDQRIVEQLNRDLGFLNDLATEEEKGRLTPAGKARVWQEVWTLAYLGIPLKY
ncbi:MAG: hypothetical protein AB3N63_09175 [Puniceicoccaceae bacterium]